MIPDDIAELASLIYPEWGELEDEDQHDLIKAAYRIKAAGWKRTEPRGLSASEQPCCEAVINNPVDPTPGERGDP